MTGEVRAAYSSRAQEYIDHLGSIASVHPSDLELVARCGHWLMREQPEVFEREVLACLAGLEPDLRADQSPAG